jgi:hypothetical protein
MDRKHVSCTGEQEWTFVQKIEEYKPSDRDKIADFYYKSLLTLLASPFRARQAPVRSMRLEDEPSTRFEIPFLCIRQLLDASKYSMATPEGSEETSLRFTTLYNGERRPTAQLTYVLTSLVRPLRARISYLQAFSWFVNVDQMCLNVLEVTCYLKTLAISKRLHKIFIPGLVQKLQGAPQWCY